MIWCQQQVIHHSYIRSVQKRFTILGHLKNSYFIALVLLEYITKTKSYLYFFQIEVLFIFLEYFSPGLLHSKKYYLGLWWWIDEIVRYELLNNNQTITAMLCDQLRLKAALIRKLFSLANGEFFIMIMLVLTQRKWPSTLRLLR